MESWDEMEARHAREREEMTKRLRQSAYRRGLKKVPLETGDKPRLETIHQLVATRRHVSARDMRSKTRLRELSHARFEAFSKAAEVGYTTTQIANFYGFDHTSVVHGIRRHHEMAEQT